MKSKQAHPVKKVYIMSSAARLKYEQLHAELVAIEKRTGLYLADGNVDHENLPTEIAALWQVNWAPQEYWVEMHRQACSAAGMRAEEQGQDINTLIGRVIY